MADFFTKKITPISVNLKIAMRFFMYLKNGEFIFLHIEEGVFFLYN